MKVMLTLNIQKEIVAASDEDYSLCLTQIMERLEEAGWDVDIESEEELENEEDA